MKLDKFSILFNGAGLGLGLFLAVYVARSFIVTEQTAGCSVRYDAATELSLLNEGGGPMLPMELQARIGHSEFGVLDNASVVAEDGAPAPAVLKVRIAQGTSSGFQEKAPRGGVGFRWTPSGMEQGEAACLKFSVKLPKDFEFSRAGMLPGLYGGQGYDPKVKLDGTNGFGARLMWREHGVVEVRAQMPDIDGGKDQREGASVGIGAGMTKLPLGKWTPVEQEVVLNTPGKKDGALRLWVGGELVLERREMMWRTDAASTLTGVLADISYGGLSASNGAPKDTEISLTPLEVRWR